MRVGLISKVAPPQADPMVDAMDDCGYRINVSAFYISFIIAPLASNASEFLAAYKISLKKTPTTITVSFSTLLGAAIMASARSARFKWYRRQNSTFGVYYTV